MRGVVPKAIYDAKTHNIGVRGLSADNAHSNPLESSAKWDKIDD